jgi:hypothetical protein
MKPRTAKPTRGRPSILSPKLTSEISRWIERGNTVDTAARLCGIAASTAYAWIEKGDLDGAGPHFEFSERISRARAKAEAAMVAVLYNVAMGKIADKYSYNRLRAAIEWLSRRSPQEWGRVERALPPPPADNKPIGVLIQCAEDEDKKLDFPIRDANQLDYPIRPIR